MPARALGKAPNATPVPSIDCAIRLCTGGREFGAEERRLIDAVAIVLHAFGEISQMRRSTTLGDELPPGVWRSSSSLSCDSCDTNLAMTRHNPPLRTTTCPDTPAPRGLSYTKSHKRRGFNKSRIDAPAHPWSSIAKHCEVVFRGSKSISMGLALHDLDEILGRADDISSHFTAQPIDSMSLNRVERTKAMVAFSKLRHVDLFRRRQPTDVTES